MDLIQNLKLKAMRSVEGSYRGPAAVSNGQTASLRAGVLHHQRLRESPAEIGVTADRSTKIENVLRLEGICKQFGIRRVLNDVSLQLRPREVLALCGASGCGKTTLLRIICGITGFGDGQLMIGPHTISAQARYPIDLYGKIGMIFQTHNLFPHMTAVANVTLALREVKRLAPREAHDRGMAELERMGVAYLAERYPATFSGGESQRVAMARALAMDPLLLLLDEPTAHLDSDRISEVCERVLELASVGATMVLATHNIEFARNAAQSYALLHEGKCLLSDDAIVLESLRSQQK